jgi:hypothetical protein
MSNTEDINSLPNDIDQNKSEIITQDLINTSLRDLIGEILLKYPCAKCIWDNLPAELDINPTKEDSEERKTLIKEIASIVKRCYQTTEVETGKTPKKSSCRCILIFALNAFAQFNYEDIRTVISIAENKDLKPDNMRQRMKECREDWQNRYRQQVLKNEGNYYDD